MSDKTTSSQVDKSAERVRTMFNEIAPKYDFLNNALSFGLASRWRRSFVSRALALTLEGRVGAERVEALDVATGTGDTIVALHRGWKRATKRGETTDELYSVGVDFSPEMLKLAERKLSKKGLSSVELLEADGCNLPFGDERFDLVTISFGLRNMADPERGVAEMARVCRPGGVLAILEFSATKFPVFSQLFRFYFHNALPLVGQAVAKNTTDAYRYLPRSVDAFESNETVLEYMRRAGIDSPERRSMNFDVLGLFIGRKA